MASGVCSRPLSLCQVLAEMMCKVTVGCPVGKVRAVAWCGARKVFSAPKVASYPEKLSSSVANLDPSFLTIQQSVSLFGFCSLLGVKIVAQIWASVPTL